MKKVWQWIKDLFVRKYEVILSARNNTIFLADSRLEDELGGVEALGKHVTVVELKGGGYGFLVSEETERNAMQGCCIKMKGGVMMFETTDITVTKIAYDLGYGYDGAYVAKVCKRKISATGQVYYEITKK